MNPPNSIKTTLRPPRPDWQMPPKPTDEHKCTHGGEIRAEAYVKQEGERSGWRLLWSCTECNAEFAEIEWPFGDDEEVDEFDLMALGFMVTEEWDSE